MVTEPPPADAMTGVTVVIAGGAALTTSWPTLETSPLGLITRTTAVPGFLMYSAGIDAVSWLELTNVTARRMPSYWARAPFTNPEPLIVNAIAFVC